MSDDQALILVVDDNEMNRDMLSRRLRRQEYEVEVAEDGEEALRKVHETAYDLVLLDIMMPNISGYEVLERIKSDPTTADLPVIMISAVDDLDSVVRCIELGAEDYLFKPFNPVLLKARVGASIARKRGGGVSPEALKPHLSTLRASFSQLSESVPEVSGQALYQQLLDSLDQLEAIIGS